jgi:GT2 family glycosyltransferase
MKSLKSLPSRLFPWLRAVIFLFLLPLDLLVVMSIWISEVLYWPFSLFRSRTPLSRPNRDKVSIVILNYEGKHLLQEFLPSVVHAADRDGRNHEIIVVDNGSQDGSTEFLAQQFPIVRVISLSQNRHFAVGNNTGVQAARNEVVILLNNDMQVEPGFIQPLLDEFQDEMTFAVSCQVFLQDRNQRREETGKTGGSWERGFLELHHGQLTDADLQQKSFPVLWAGGGSCAVDRKKFLALGGFDPLFFPFYLEDADLSYQAWKRGWKILLAPASVVIHKHRGTSSVKFSAGYIRNTVRKNYYLFIWKNITDHRWLLSHCWRLAELQLSPKDQDQLEFEVKAFLRAFLQLPEALIKRLRNRSQYQRSDRDIFDENSHFFRPWNWQNYIDFSKGNFEEHLEKGWFPLETTQDGGYRWTAKECSFLLFPRGGEEFLQVRGVIPDVEISKRPEVGLDIYQDGLLICSQWFSRPQRVNLKIRIPLAVQRPHRFGFKLSASFCPLRVGTGEDSRELGMILSEIGLV